MANPTCTKASLVAAGACYNGFILNPKLKQALRVYFMVQELAAIGGTDYTAAIDQLAIDATNVFRDVGEDQREAMELAILRNNAVAAGASVPSDINELEDAIKCIKNEDEIMLEWMRELLLCKLGVSKDYPQ